MTWKAGGAKYNAKKTECGAGHLHDSGMEAKRCTALTTLESDGTITHLMQQPTFPIVIDGRKVCVYNADFSYRMADSGLPIVEDVKGMTTPVFSLKKKLVEAMHPGTVISVWPVKVRKKRKPKKPA